MLYSKLKDQIIQLRSSGKTYSEIRQELGIKISKSTLSYYCSGIKLSLKQKERIETIGTHNLHKARQISIKIRREIREAKIDDIYARNNDLIKLLKHDGVAKLVLGALYLGEGSKGRRSCLTFGNSDEKIIKLFLLLLRASFVIDESRLRCTLQCRDGVETEPLKKYWSKVTGISLERFYKTQIDRRYNSSKKIKGEYKGVCRLDYMSSVLFEEIMAIGNIMCSFKNK